LLLACSRKEPLPAELSSGVSPQEVLGYVSKAGIKMRFWAASFKRGALRFFCYEEWKFKIGTQK
jgi:hypothetical protein